MKERPTNRQHKGHTNNFKSPTIGLGVAYGDLPFWDMGCRVPDVGSYCYESINKLLMY